MAENRETAGEYGVKVVIGTSAWISFLLSKNPEKNAVAFILGLMMEGAVLNYVSKEAIEEIKRKFAHPKIMGLRSGFLPRNNFQDPAVLLRLIKETSVFIEPKIRVALCRDESDNKWLELAFESGADAIITYDRDLLDMRNDKKRLQVGDFQVYVIRGMEFVQLYREGILGGTKS
ncbi:putative toxin-antitoxin system toxin component, PIN family [Thermococcus stetteri]|uniref:putative toxin-antitoxin system toxin component, PIN family n=1 Tax=Thermococcus stetteri TaxID=49900 RepID=UPI001AE6AF5A|nr:putative toxin-antitoxin system toxin component, PIN family [Thermococcus stetteri]MBP1912138.1 putative PIN family toxin of toxin-antitoxin system [Thermococcus stetteri]